MTERRPYIGPRDVLEALLEADAQRDHRRDLLATQAVVEAVQDAIEAELHAIARALGLDHLPPEKMAAALMRRGFRIIEQWGRLPRVGIAPWWPRMIAGLRVVHRWCPSCAGPCWRRQNGPRWPPLVRAWPL